MIEVPSTNRLEAFLGSVPPSGLPVSQRLGGMFHRAYLLGFQGCFVDGDGSPEWARKIAREEAARFIAECRCEPKAEAAMPSELHGIGAGKRAVHYVHAMVMDARILSGSQDYGNCTSWMTREMVGCEWVTDIVERREFHQYITRPGTAVVYGSRGHGGAGMALSTAMNVVHNLGIQLEKAYPGHDLSTEALDESAGNRWGRSGPPRDLLEIIKNDRVEQVSSVTDSQAIMDLLYAGHFVGHGSGLTAASNGDPVSPLKSIGGHAQAVIGYDDTDEFREWYREKTGKRLNDAVAIHDQSWGNWNSVTNWPDHLWGPKPEGAWVVTWSDLMRIVRQWNDCYAVSNVLGFPMKELPPWQDALDGWL